MFKNFKYYKCILRAHKIFPFKTVRVNSLCNSEMHNKIKYSLSCSPVVHQIKSDGDIFSAFRKEKTNEVNDPRWENVTTLLSKHDFKESECFKMIKNCPVLLQIPLEDIEKGLDEWATCKINYSVLREMLINEPLLISVANSDIQQRVLYYRELCKSQKTLISFFIKCPNAIMDDFKSIVEKIEYLLKDKHVEKAELFQSMALTKSLDFMNLRITLLEKCGIYKVIVTSPHKIQKVHNHKNPTLGLILDTDDETFSKQVAGITLEEYITYNELFQSNKIDILNDGYEDDDDDD